ncbi:molecular chaperone GrpE (heat shock protein) [Virgibacillus halotolerans]|uniref:hypothetical protein n=1 Tax=Virgibacillus halotolerans TaxID=1071053 RepID=UPI0019615EAD|nr:hypothetical protein [Virgibacillus halotolerans]MBM7600434.1 molecular chaperone GrpE (heat shock protein) [Virgibacillus halotolerans]
MPEETNEQQTQLPVTDPVNGEQASAETETTEQPAETTPEQKIPYDRFKAKVDEANALKERLDNIEKQQAEDERKRLEEAQDYKKLAEQYKADLEAQKADVLNAKKDTLLTQAGYTAEQIGLLRNTVVGETDEDIAKSIEDLKAVIAPKPTYVDPSAGNGARDKAESADPSSYGRELYERVFNKKK